MQLSYMYEEIKKNPGLKKTATKSAEIRSYNNGVVSCNTEE